MDIQFLKKNGIFDLKIENKADFVKILILTHMSRKRPNK